MLDDSDNETLEIVTRPIGLTYNEMVKHIDESENQVEFFKAVICVMEAALSMHANGFVHWDIRWPNIIYDWRYSQSYLLIDFENLRPEHDNENNCGFMSRSAIIDAGFIILLFRETRNMILNIRGIEEIVSLANYLYEPETRIERIYEKRDEICRHFWSFYKEHGNLKCSSNSY